ncbi:MAG: hypothetical protein ILP02_02615, partial [Clostridia bacterium]|nr:hypothetical protein [Clostridia bacterium]
TWNRVGNALYMTSGGKDYYLAYADGEWKVILLDYFTINDGSGNYLRVTGNNAFANGNSSTATHFYFTTENGANSSGRAYCVVDGTTYYLYNDNGTLQTTTTQNTGTQWSNDGSSLYVTSGNTVYALRYDTTWNIKAIYEGRYITDGTNYMTVTGTTIGNTTDPDEATVFIFSNNGANPAGTITVAGTTNYLRNNNGTLQISGTSTTWTNDGTRLYTGNNNNRRNLGFYSGSWQMTGSNTTTVTSSLGYTIGYNGHYLCVDSSGNISDTTTAANASLWSGTSGQIYTTVNGTNYYLYRNGTTLSTTTDANNATNWTNYNNKLYYRTSNGLIRYDFYYVTYNSAWTIGTSINVTNNNGRNACTTLTITQQNETITIVSRAVSSDTTRPVVYVTPETAAAPALTVNSFTAAGTAISFSDAVTEEVTFEETTVQTVLKTVETGLDSGYPTYFPIRIARSGESDYDQAVPYKASEKNTGYIVSGGNFYDGSTTGTKVGDIRISEYAISNIEGSYSTTGLTVTRIAQGGNYLYLEKLQDDTYRIANTTNASIADFWQYSDSKLFTTIGKTTYYLTYSGGLALATNVSNAVNWTFSNNNRLAYNNNYIRYNNGWTTGAANQGNLTLTLGTLNLNNIYTYDGSGNHTLTQAQKTEAFTQAALQLSQTLVGSSNVYGLHFMNAEISLDHLVTAKTANIFGNHYVDYELPEDSIDFNVIERGTINFFAGEYFNGNNAFFSLHQVFRYKETDPEVVAGTKKANDIKDIKEIIYVYKTTENGDKNPYVYYYGDGTYTNADGSYSGATQLPSGYTITFRTSWITNPSGLQTDNNATNKKVYYFEIPCNDGEYCLGSVAGKTGAYLIYLDIAANGGDTVASAISSTGNDVTNTFAVEFRDVPDTMPHSVLMFSIEVPDNAKDKISISTSFDKTDTDPPHQNGLYTINIVNNSTEDLTIYVYLCDDDYNLTTAFQYAYQIKYSNGSQTDDYVTTAVGSVFQMMAGFVIPSTGAATEVSYH